MDIADKHQDLIPVAQGVVTESATLLLNSTSDLIPVTSTMIQEDGQVVMILPRFNNVRLGTEIEANFLLVFSPHAPCLFGGKEIIPTLRYFVHTVESIIQLFADRNLQTPSSPGTSVARTR